MQKNTLLLKKSVSVLFKVSAAALCAGSVFFAGVFCADMLPDNLLNISAQTKNSIRSTADIFFAPHSYSIARDYIIALADSTVKFEKLPSYRTDIPFQIISQLYNKAAVDKITIMGLNIEISCTIYDGAEFDSKALEKTLESIYGIEKAKVKRDGKSAVIDIKTVT